MSRSQNCLSVDSFGSSGSPGIIAIPARLESRRLPRKLLLAETGRELLRYAIEIGRQAVAAAPGLLSGPIVVADAEPLLEIARRAGVEALPSLSPHSNGTSRVAEALRAIQAKGIDPPFILNLQGDHPELDPEVLIRVAQELIASPASEMATAATPLNPDDAVILHDPHTVKVVCDKKSKATGFFRKISDIPAVSTCLRHIGLYAYRTDFLLRLAELPPSPDALREDLEQLTPLALGATIRVAIVPASSSGHGIDTPDDYRKFVQRIASGAPHPQPRGKG